MYGKNTYKSYHFGKKLKCTERYFKPLLSNFTTISNIGVIIFEKVKTLRVARHRERHFNFLSFIAKTHIFYVICI